MIIQNHNSFLSYLWKNVALVAEMEFFQGRQSYLVHGGGKMFYSFCMSKSFKLQNLSKNIKFQTS